MGQGVFEKTTDFLGQVKSELRKVTWPSRKETLASTRVVILLVLVVALFLWLVDYGLSAAIRLFLR
ncbi:MAG: preprotein translocase subunit SecE [Deltaproteobacteria bacterium]|nr:preprotein translocase subunit SecE [Deltaproteobacteria bacterium]